MQQEKPKPEATVQAAEGTVKHAHGNGAGQVPDGNGRTGGDMSKGNGNGTASCRTDNEQCRFRITTFPERIAIVCGIGRSPYIIWVLLSLVLLVMRISAMVLCGEETGRFAVNIVQALLPGLIGILIIYYSKQAQKVTLAFCKLFHEKYKEEVAKETSARIHKVFSNRAMVISGIVFTLTFSWMIKYPRLYPTPVHNIQHRAAVRDRITVNVGLMKPEMGNANNEAALLSDWFELPSGDKIRLKDTGKTKIEAESRREDTTSPVASPGNGLWGWVRLPSGKAFSFTDDGEERARIKVSPTPGWLDLSKNPPKTETVRGWVRLPSGKTAFFKDIAEGQAPSDPSEVIGELRSPSWERIDLVECGKRPDPPWDWIALPQGEEIFFRKCKEEECNETALKETPSSGNTQGEKGIMGLPTPFIWGWVKLPLGKVIHLAEEMEQMRDYGGNGTREVDWYKLLTHPPQETYESHLPNPNHDEELGWVDPKSRSRIDQDWNEKFPSGKTASQGTCLIETQKQHKPMDKDLIALLKERRARRLPPILRDFYRDLEVEERWAYSQWTYTTVMLPLFFMSGAMLWFMGAVITTTWGLGRGWKNGNSEQRNGDNAQKNGDNAQKNGDNAQKGSDNAQESGDNAQESGDNVQKDGDNEQKSDKDEGLLSKMDLTLYPHPGKSIGAAGDLLWQIAFITGSIYSLVMICQFFAHPDTLTMILAGMFSPLIVALFIVPQYNLHKLMVEAKYKKIEKLDKVLSETLKDIEDEWDTADNIKNAQRLLRLQKDMAETKDWPFDLKSIAMVISSVVIPIFMAIFTIYQHFK